MPPLSPAGTQMILLPDGPVYCEREVFAKCKEQKHKQRRTVQFWDATPEGRSFAQMSLGDGLHDALENKENAPDNSSRSTQDKRKRWSSSEDYFHERSVMRKPLSPLATPQLRFIDALHGLTHGVCISEQRALERLLGSLR
jgi:hypothetical protein